jgi:YidC/Oxa1 family membrane protein insertase
MADFFHTTIFQPLYNGLVFLIGWMPLHDLGLAIILLTILVRFILVPLTHGSTVAQKKMRHITPEVNKIKSEYAHDAQEQNKKVMELYAKHGINPFSSCLVFILQIPIVLGLYWVFQGLGETINPDELYSFVSDPGFVHTNFLGLVDLAKPSIILSLIAAVVQYFQISLSMPPLVQSGVATKDMKYIFPVIVFLVSYNISAAIALYWTVTNLFSVVHEYIVQRQVAKTIQTV